jgi:selenium metabolism protein YedF
MIRDRSQQENGMEKTIDARGKACPQPVLMTKDALEGVDEGAISVLIDSEISKDNVVRFATSQGCSTDVEEKDGTFVVKVTKGKAETKEKGEGEISEAKKTSNIVVYVNTNTMGKGDDELGAILIKGFIKTLKDVQPLPSRIIFVNKGVFLTTEGSELIPEIQGLEKMGIEILSCGTCLDFFHRKETLKAGLASNMYDITSALMQADKVVVP